MTSQPTDGPNLRLVDEHHADTLPFERRAESRYVVTQRVTALRPEVVREAVFNHICSLQVVNISDSGLGAVAQEPMAIGTPLTIFFPPHGPERGFDVHGRVVRCIARNQGHEVGVRFESRLAA